MQGLSSSRQGQFGVDQGNCHALIRRSEQNTAPWVPHLAGAVTGLTSTRGSHGFGQANVFAYPDQVVGQLNAIRQMQRTIPEWDGSIQRNFRCVRRDALTIPRCPIISVDNPLFKPIRLYCWPTPANPLRGHNLADQLNTAILIR